MKKDKFFVEQDVEFPVAKKDIKIDEKAKNVTEELEKVVVADDNNKTKAKSLNKKWMLTIVVVLFNVVAILILALMDFGGDGEKVPFSTVLSVIEENYIWGLYAIALFFCSFIFESLRRYILLRVTVRKRLLRTSIFATGLCKYYDSITPLGSGGQPFEIYYLKSSGVPGSIASGITIVCYALGQFAFVILSIVVIAIVGFQSVSVEIIVLAIIGIVVNIILPIGILMFSITPRIGIALGSFITKFLYKIKIIKDKDKFYKKVVESMLEYARCIKFFFKKYSFWVLLNFIFEIIARVALYSIPYCVMRMFGIGADAISYWELLDLCLICYCAVAIMPSPGNAGAAEISFYSIFSSMLAGGYLFWGVTYWRFSSYYLYIILGLIIMVAERITAYRKRKKDEKALQQGERIEPEQELNDETKQEILHPDEEVSLYLNGFEDYKKPTVSEEEGVTDDTNNSEVPLSNNKTDETASK